ncbi:MAG: hypothetical protein GEV04_02230 [Actinophytocola sp.]|nr:hypothetical protein [Actinophytocola sp.]
MNTLAGIADTLTSFGPTLWLALVLGVVIGMLVGVLPGLTFVMGLLLILPFTYGMPVDIGVALMVAVYIAGTYGGAITAVLLRIPGTPDQVPLLWDGYEMTRKGRAAEALGWAAVAAFAGGMAAWLLVTFAAKPFATVALNFGPAEYCVIVVLGLTSVLALGERSVAKSLTALMVGMLLATVGVEAVYGTVRFDFGIPILRDGIDYLPAMVGIYALGHVIIRFGAGFAGGVGNQPTRVRTSIPGLSALRRHAGSLSRGVGVGSLMGAVPGAGATVASFLAYGVEKQVGKERHLVGTGSPNGVIAPQAASTATVGGAFIPLLVLGIPGSAATAVILGALLLHNIQPGPQIFAQQPELVYTVMAALLVSVVLMTLFGLLASKPMVRLLRIPEAYVAAVIVLFAYIGAFAIRNSLSDVWIMTIFAVLGYFMQRKGYPLAPLVLGAILGPLAERYFVTAMIASNNDVSVFITRPISAGLIVAWIGVLSFLIYRAVRDARQTSGAATASTTTPVESHDAQPK